MAIVMIFIGSVSAESVPVIPENMDSLDTGSTVKTGYQTDITTLHDNKWIDPNGVKWSTPIRITNDSSTTVFVSIEKFNSMPPILDIIKFAQAVWPTGAVTKILSG